MKSRVSAAGLAVFLTAASLAFACGPDLPYAVFTHERHPDVPLEPFVAGQIGIVQPAWARSYLVVSYRWLSGSPLGADEQAGALRTWRARAQPWWAESKQAGLPDWLEARAKIPGLPKPLRELSSAMADGSYEYGFSSGPDAFRLAVRTLNDRLTMEGARSPALRAWVLAQDTVFAIVAGGEYRLAENAQSRTDADRLYQLAAVAFHDGNWAEAEPRFRVLAQSPLGRNRALARYLAVRCVVRSAQDGDEEGAIDRDKFTRAEGELRDMLEDPALAEVHPAVRRLLGFVTFRLRPVERFADLSRALRASDPGFGQDLWDFALLLDTVTGADDAPTAVASSRDALVAASANDDLADWVLTYQRGPAAGTRAYLRWKASRSLPWLVAALAAAQPNGRETPELLEAAALVPPMSPAFVTVSAQRARLLAQRNEAPGARRVLDAVLARPALPLGSRNELLAQRAALASTWPALLADLSRAPADVIYGPDVLVEPTPVSTPGWDPDSEYVRQREGVLRLRRRSECLDTDGAIAFNRALPLARWQDAVGSDAVPDRVRRLLAIAGWTRATLLADSVAAVSFAQSLRALEPSLGADLTAWEKAAPGEAREFAAAFLVARRPGMRPYVGEGLDRLEAFDKLDDYRDNWWSSREQVTGQEYDGAVPGEAATGYSTRDGWKAGVGTFAFLTSTERTAAVEQGARLAKATAAPQWMGTRILAFAKTHPRDPRVPEALHRLVRSVRLGASDARSARMAKEAFTLLHSRYPASPWTKKTKSWGV